MIALDKFSDDHPRSILIRRETVRRSLALVRYCSVVVFDILQDSYSMVLLASAIVQGKLADVVV